MATNKDLGKVMIVPKGAYSGATAYTKLDLVSYEGSSYIALQNTTGNLPTNETYWQCVSAKGDNIGVTSMVKTATNENVDTYTITFTDNTTQTFTVTNAKYQAITQEEYDTLVAAEADDPNTHYLVGLVI